MQQAAGITRNEAKDVRRVRAADAGQVSAIRTFLASAPGLGPDATPLAKLRAAEAQKSLLVQQGQAAWSDQAIEVACNISLVRASKERFNLRPDSPRTAEVRTFLAGKTGSNAAKFKLAWHRNQERVGQGLEEWPLRSLIKASGASESHSNKVAKRLASEQSTSGAADATLR